MAKKTLGYSLKGDLDISGMTITETTKDNISVYDLQSILNEFDGQPVTFSIKLDTDVEPLE